MKSRVIFALFLSLILVGGATFLRGSRNTSSAGLISVENTDNAPFIMDEVLVSEMAPLSQTDALSQDLFSDYMALKAEGEATSENLEKLAEVYSARVLATSQTPVTTAKLSLVSDSQENITAYSQVMLAARARYEAQTRTLSGASDFTDINDPGFKKLMQSISTLYAVAAGEMKKIPVPASLAANHAKLINNYLSSSEATLKLMEIEENPLSAFGALGTQAKNSQEEEVLFANIRLVMIQQGFSSTP